MVGDDKGRENLGDYGDFWGIFLIFLLLWIFLWGILGAARSSSEQLGFFGVGILGALGATRSTRILEEMVGTGAWWGLALASFSECSECSECSDDKKVWGVGVGIFCWWFGFFL